MTERQEFYLEADPNPQFEGLPDVIKHRLGTIAFLLQEVSKRARHVWLSDLYVGNSNCVAGRGYPETTADVLTV